MINLDQGNQEDVPMSMWSSHIPNLEVISVLPTLCGREDGDGEENPAGTGGAGAGEPSGSGNGPTGTSDNDGESSGDPQKKITAQNEIIERLSGQRDGLTAQLQELQKYKDDAENAKLSDQQKIDKRIKELEESEATKSATLQKLVINNAFLAANEVTWHDPETALSLLDTSSFEIVEDKNGIPTVKDKKAFATAMLKLAEDKPYLVKTPSDSGDGEKPGPKAWQGKTGDAPKPKASEAAAERARLEKKFPALRGRR
jgi:hypothetical protein